MQEAIQRLLGRAQEVNELATAATLLRLRTGGRPFDPLTEAYELGVDLMDLIQAPLSGLARMRLLLMLYVQLIELEDVHHILANLLWVSLGNTYQTHPFSLGHDLPAYLDQDANLRRMAQVISELAHRADEGEVGAFYQNTCFPSLVEAFRTSAYALTPSSMLLHQGDPLVVDGRTTRSLPAEWLYSRLWRFVSTMIDSITIFREALRQYTTPDQVLSGHLVQPFSVDNARVYVEDGVGLVGLRPT